MRKLYQLSTLNNQNGVTAVVIAILIVFFLGLVALAIDIGYNMVVRNELQNVSDAAALAAVRQLGEICETPCPLSDEQADAIKKAAIHIAKQNQAGGKPTNIHESDILIGQWHPDSAELIETLCRPNAVMVRARRDDTAAGSPNGPITTFFGRILGIPTMNLRKDATAALGGICIARPAIPVGISRHWFEKPEYCNQRIKLHPTNDPESCAGWNTYDEKPANAETLRKILTGLTEQSIKIPEPVAGKDRFQFIGGDVASDFDHMAALFNAMKGLDDNKLDFDNDPNTWTTYVPVYEWADCSNPRGDLLIVGFAMVTITSVVPPPDKIIWATVVCDTLCDNSSPERAACNDFGIRSRIPHLVQ